MYASNVCLNSEKSIAQKLIEPTKKKKTSRVRRNRRKYTFSNLVVFEADNNSNTKYCAMYIFIGIASASKIYTDLFYRAPQKLNEPILFTCDLDFFVSRSAFVCFISWEVISCTRLYIVCLILQSFRWLWLWITIFTYDFFYFISGSYLYFCRSVGRRCCC